MGVALTEVVGGGRSLSHTCNVGIDPPGPIIKGGCVGAKGQGQNASAASTPGVAQAMLEPEISLGAVEDQPDRVRQLEARQKAAADKKRKLASRSYANLVSLLAKGRSRNLFGDGTQKITSMLNGYEKQCLSLQPKEEDSLTDLQKKMESMAELVAKVNHNIPGLASSSKGKKGRASAHAEDDGKAMPSAEVGDGGEAALGLASAVEEAMAEAVADPSLLEVKKEGRTCWKATAATMA